MANNNQNNNNLIKKNRTTVITIRVAVPNSNRQTFSSQPTNIYTAHIHAGCFNSSWHIPSDTNKQSGSHCFTSNCNQQPTPNVSNSNHLAFHIPTQGNLVLVPIGNHLKKPLANNPSRTRFCTNQQPTGKPSHSSSKRLCLRREYCKIAPAMPQKKWKSTFVKFRQKSFLFGKFCKECVEMWTKTAFFVDKLVFFYKNANPILIDKPMRCILLS